MKMMSIGNLFKKLGTFFKSVFEIDTLIYIIVCIALPFIVLQATDIYPGDFVTLIFMVVVVIMYFITVILVCPIIETNRQLRCILKESRKCTSFEKISNIIKQKKYYKVRNPFIEFEKNTKCKIDEEGQKKVYASVDSSYYIDEESLINNDLKTKTIDQISQSFTGVGIFGTFLGIVRGVSSLDVTDSEAMKNGIATLLAGVKVSFNSSLYGILASVIIILIYKALLDMTNTKINRLNNIISDLVIPDDEDNNQDMREDVDYLKKRVEDLGAQNKKLLELLKDNKNYTYLS